MSFDDTVFALGRGLIENLSLVRAFFVLEEDRLGAGRQSPEAVGVNVNEFLLIIKVRRRWNQHFLPGGQAWNEKRAHTRMAKGMTLKAVLTFEP